MTKSKKAQKKKKKDQSVGGLVATLERIDKKLDLLNTMTRTMPAMLLVVGAIVGTLGYISLTPQTSTAPVELPVTGDAVGVTSDFVILTPEYRSEVRLPIQISGLSLNGFYTNEKAVEFYIQKSGGIKKSLGYGEKGTEEGKYTAVWEEASSGLYFVWAEITGTDNVTVSSEKVAVDVI